MNCLFKVLVGNGQLVAYILVFFPKVFNLSLQSLVVGCE